MLISCNALYSYPHAETKQNYIQDRGNNLMLKKYKYFCREHVSSLTKVLILRIIYSYDS